MLSDKEYNKLVPKLISASKSYYKKSELEMTDAAFDEAILEIEEYETTYPDKINPKSPTQSVPDDHVSGFKKIKHEIPMMSIAKVYGYPEVEKFINDTNRDISKIGKYVAEMKIDGAGLTLIYEKGILQQAVTRGRYGTGDLVTENALQVNKLSSRISSMNKMEIRGEVIIKRSNFEHINKLREDNGEDKLANPRNGASGGLKSQDHIDAKNRGMSFIAYSIVQGGSKDSHLEDLKQLKEWGFETPDFVSSKNFDAIKAFCEKMKAERLNLEYDTDGIVIKLDEKCFYKALGGNATSPHYLKAYKFPAEEKEAILEKVEFQVGRTGIICPVAIFKNGIQLAGTTVKRATLHNFDEIDRLGIMIGDEVIVVKKGEIIPKVLRLFKKGTDRTAINPPSHCPVCSGKVLRADEEVAYICSNPKCHAKLIGSFEKFCGRDAMDMRGISEATLEQIIEAGLVKTFDELYDLKESDLRNLDRFGDSKSENVIKAIQGSKAAGLERLLVGLGIPSCGQGTSKDLSEHFKDIDNILDASIEDFQKVPGVKETAHKFREYFDDRNNQETIRKLKLHGVITKNEENKKMILDNKLQGKTFVLTGTLSQKRDDFVSLIEKSGGVVSKAISRSTDYLLMGSDVGENKTTKAEKLGVKMIDEDTFFSMLAK